MYQKANRSRPVLFRTIAVAMALALLLSSSAFAAQAPQQPATPRVTAESAIVIDYDTGLALYEKNADTMMIPASMTKVMTAYIIMEELEAGRLTLDTQVPISAKNAALSRNSAYPMPVPLPSGGTVSVEDLLKLILIPSASASCVVMAEYISGTEEAFVQRMNDTAKRLGMTAAYENPHGAQIHYITARSQAILVRECIRRFPEMLKYTSMTSMTFNGKTETNTNRLLPGCDFAYEGCDGFKTGTITAAGYCLSATAVRNGHRLISVVMKSSNTDTRHTDSIALLDYGFNVLAQNASYLDVAYHWSRSAVDSLNTLGVELHPTDGLYHPDAAITRGEFAAMLCSALEKSGAMPAAQEGAEPVINDIAGHWAESYILKAARAGLLTGYENGTFRPDSTITRQEIMVMLDQALDLPDQNGLGFSDDGDIAFWALSAVSRVCAAGIVGGYDGKLAPNAETTRGEAAVIVNRAISLFPSAAA